MEDNKLCPLFSIAFSKAVECYREMCAWWNSNTELCIVQDLSVIADWAHSPHLNTSIEVRT